MNVKLYYPNRNTKSATVEVGDLTLHFSYETVIAFNSPFSGFVISKNIWSMTTGRHLNEIDPDKTKRVSNEVFETYLKTTLRHYRLEGF